MGTKRKFDGHAVYSSTVSKRKLVGRDNTAQQVKSLSSKSVAVPFISTTKVYDTKKECLFYTLYIPLQPEIKPS